MTTLEPKDVLFLGVGTSTIAWYRTFMPALALQTDWAGVLGEPDNLTVLTSQIRSRPVKPKWDDYKIFVVQQPCGNKWAKWIRDRQRDGARVLFEVDDDLHAVAKAKSHPYQRKIKKRLSGYEQCMRMADGLIVSTDFLYRRYTKYNKRAWLCEPGIDFDRYQLERPERAVPRVGWSGATGNEHVLFSWIEEIDKQLDNGRGEFMSIGIDWSRWFYNCRYTYAPYTTVESYPSALANFDIAMAPALPTNFFRAKSQLRWIEASALGIPVIADASYDKIDHGITGFRVKSLAEVGIFLNDMLKDQQWRNEIGEQARTHVRDHYHIADKCEQWIQVFEEVVE